MEDLTESIGQLSTKAREWRPGMGFQSGQTNTAGTSTNAEQQQQPLARRSLSQNSSPWTPQQTNPPSSVRAISQDSTASASGINVNASNWVPQHHQQQQQQQQQQQPSSSSVHQPENVNDRDLTQSNSSSLPTGLVPSPHQQTFISNNPISMPFPKTLLNDSGNVGSGGSGSSTKALPNHLLSKLYRTFHIDCASQMAPNDERYKAIPQSFVNAMPLESFTSSVRSNSSDTRSSFGYPSSVFKVTSLEDGRLYCLRRFDNVKCVNGKIASHVSNMWNHAVRKQQRQYQKHRQQHVLNHPGIVRFYKAFYVNQNRALFFIHEYYPNALTLREALYGLKRGESGKLNLNSNHRTFHPLNESTIWSYITQIVTAVKSIHSGGLAVRVLQLNHILVTHDVGSGFTDEALASGGDGGGEHILMTNRVRLRLNCIGVADALEFESRKEVEECQKEDMRCLGRIILSLATGMEIGSDVDEDILNKCDAYISQSYSSELYDLTMALIARKRMGRLGHLLDVDPPSIQNVCRVVGEYAMEELDSVHVTVDKMDEALASEYESGRGLRLLLKLGFVNERPEFGVDTRWSESGDCYVLKLFRDYGKVSKLSYHIFIATRQPFTLT